MSNKEIAPALLRQLLRYDRATGKLFWRHRDEAGKWWNARCAGKEAFRTVTPSGYRKGKIFGKDYLAHRVIWAMEKDAWPAECIDHIDGCVSNNRLRNLREATYAQNGRNRKSRQGSSSKYLGVTWDKEREKWKATISLDGNLKHLGRFENEKEAGMAYDSAAKLHYGEYANPNFGDRK